MFEGNQLDVIMNECVDVDAITSFLIINGKKITTTKERNRAMVVFFETLAYSIDSFISEQDEAERAIEEARREAVAAKKKAQQDEIDNRVKLLETQRDQLDATIKVLVAPAVKAKAKK